jgi:hypothetical protein
LHGRLKHDSQQNDRKSQTLLGLTITEVMNLRIHRIQFGLIPNLIGIELGKDQPYFLERFFLTRKIGPYQTTVTVTHAAVDFNKGFRS